MENKKQLLVSEINHYELLLKWYGVPLYVFLSGAGTLVWLFLNITKEINEHSLLNLSVWAIVVSSFIWKIFRFNFQRLSGDIFEDTLKTISPFMPNLSKMLFLEILLDFICLFWVFQESEKKLFFYSFIFFYFLSILTQSFALTIDSFLHILESAEARPVVKKIILDKFRIFHFVEITVLGLYLYFIIKVSEKVGFDLEFFKSSIVLVGISLLGKFYLDSNQYIVILTEKRKELNEIFNR